MAYTVPGIHHQSSPQNQSAFSFTVHDTQPWFSTVSVAIPAVVVDRLYQLALHAQRNHAIAQGFTQYNAPIEYIEKTYQHNLISHIQEFLFKYVAVNNLYEQIRAHKILLAGEPRLSGITVEPHKPAIFYFELSLYPSLSFLEWKYFPFKAPKRKNYKDLDRQVETFVNDETAQKEQYKNAGIKIGDWVNFSLTLLDENQQPLIENYASSFWIRLGEEEADRAFVDLFNNKKIGDQFVSSNRCIQEYLSDPFSTPYTYRIEILEVIPTAFFCLDLFKHHFKIKTNKELYQKFIEVYSYRNDLSLRRSMAEESLRALVHKHPFDVPNYLILRQQNLLLEIVQHNPDYYVYRMQKDFKERVRELAYKQIQEQIFIDQLAYDENVMVSANDVKSYLNLTMRPRTKEFIYFDPPITKMHSQEVPIHTSELMRTCLREKTLNHIIHHLTKK